MTRDRPRAVPAAAALPPARPHADSGAAKPAIATSHKKARRLPLVAIRSKCSWSVGPGSFCGRLARMICARSRRSRSVADRCEASPTENGRGPVSRPANHGRHGWTRKIPHMPFWSWPADMLRYR